jgi:hypothetical protein
MVPSAFKENRRPVSMSVAGGSERCPFDILTFPDLGLHSYLSRPQEGRLAIVTDAGRDAVDAAASGADEATGRIPRKGSVSCR